MEINLTRHASNLNVNELEIEEDDLFCHPVKCNVERTLITQKQKVNSNLL